MQNNFTLETYKFNSEASDNEILNVSEQAETLMLKASKEIIAFIKSYSESINQMKPSKTGSNYKLN